MLTELLEVVGLYNVLHSKLFFFHSICSINLRSSTYTQFFYKHTRNFSTSPCAYFSLDFD